MTVPRYPGDLYATLDVHIPSTLTPDHPDTGKPVVTPEVQG